MIDLVGSFLIDKSGDGCQKMINRPADLKCWRLENDESGSRKAVVKEIHATH